MENLLKIYTFYDKEAIESIMDQHEKAPEKRIAQRALARGVTEIVHGVENAEAVENLTAMLFDKETDFTQFTEDEIQEFAKYLPVAKKGVMLVDTLAENCLAESKKKAREYVAQGAITINGEKIKDDIELNQVAIIKKGKNKFLVVK